MSQTVTNETVQVEYIDDKIRVTNFVIMVEHAEISDKKKTMVLLGAG